MSISGYINKYSPAIAMISRLSGSLGIVSCVPYLIRFLMSISSKLFETYPYILSYSVGSLMKFISFWGSDIFSFIAIFLAVIIRVNKKLMQISEEDPDRETAERPAGESVGEPEEEAKKKTKDGLLFGIAGIAIFSWVTFA